MLPSTHSTYVPDSSVLRPGCAAASESFEQAIIAADAAAYASSSGDFSSQTGFEIGDTGTNPNLEQARLFVQDARASLKDALSLISAT
eukprot:6172751-Pleurochrysis_carterae.AAC.5